MVPERVIVTLVNGNGSPFGDYELPATAAIGRFLSDLGMLLSETAPGYAPTGSVPRLSFNGTEIKKDESLASLGIWDGSCLTVF